jgi:hypothetical protein
MGFSFEDSNPGQDEIFLRWVGNRPGFVNVEQMQKLSPIKAKGRPKAA